MQIDNELGGFAKKLKKATKRVMKVHKKLHAPIRKVVKPVLKVHNKLHAPLIKTTAKLGKPLMKVHQATSRIMPKPLRRVHDAVARPALAIHDKVSAPLVKAAGAKHLVPKFEQIRATAPAPQEEEVIYEEAPQEEVVYEEAAPEDSAYDYGADEVEQQAQSWGQDYAPTVEPTAEPAQYWDGSAQVAPAPDYNEQAPEDEGYDWSSGAYGDYYSEQEDFDAGLEGLGFNWDDFTANVTKVAAPLTQAYQQNKLFKAQLKRAEQGLAPLEAEQIQPPMRVQAGIDSSLTKPLMIGGAVLLAALVLPMVLKRGR